jgi:hypothetical protein
MYMLLLIKSNNKIYRQTWTSRRILIVISIAILYGLWFNILDSAGFCLNQDKIQSKSCDNRCIILPVGKIFGGDQIYQPWNVVGHLIPGLFLVWWTPKKVELFVAGALLSSIVMDSPLWGMVRIYEHALPLWHFDLNEDMDSFSNTCDIHKWIQFYYDPVGTYGVWDINSSIPSASMISWSLVGRSVGVGLLIWWQTRQEKEGKEFSLPKLVLKIGKRCLSTMR